MVRLASSDKWKAPQINKKRFSKLFLSKKKKILLSGESRGGARGARLLLFSTKMRPEEPRKFFWETASPYPRVWMNPPPHLQVWIRHCCWQNYTIYYYCQLLVLLLTKMAAFSRGCKSRITLITE